MDMRSILHMMAYSKELRDHSQILCQKHKHVDIVHLIFGAYQKQWEPMSVRPNGFP